MRLGVDEVGVTELMAVAEHTHATAVVAGALLLESPAGASPLVGRADGAADEATRALLDEVRAASREEAGLDAVPALWAALARNPRHLEASWRKDRVVMRDGALAARDKRRVALGVAMNAGSRYLIEYHAAALRRAGDTDEDLLEVLAVVDHFNSLNVLTDAMQVETDIRPPS
jgi:AhpD family alkylhydroperoxidase